MRATYSVGYCRKCGANVVQQSGRRTSWVISGLCCAFPEHEGFWSFDAMGAGVVWLEESA